MTNPTSDSPASDVNSNSFVLPDPDKIEALAEFAAGAGHEINNPLATIIGRAQLLLKDEHDPQRRQMLASIGAQAYRIRDMIGDTMLFGRPPLPELRDVNLFEAAHRVVATLATDLAEGRCSVKTLIPEELTVCADPTQLSIVLTEVLRNCRHALQPDGGLIRLVATSDAENATIEISDSGNGFTDIEQRHAFDPFFSGRQAGRGLGFGLPKCWRIIDLHRGRIEIQSSPAGPTTVRIEWPVASPLNSKGPGNATERIRIHESEE